MFKNYQGKKYTQKHEFLHKTNFWKNIYFFYNSKTNYCLNLIFHKIFLPSYLRHDIILKYLCVFCVIK